GLLELIHDVGNTVEMLVGRDHRVRRLGIDGVMDGVPAIPGGSVSVAVQHWGLTQAPQRFSSRIRQGVTMAPELLQKGGGAGNGERPAVQKIVEKPGHSFRLSR